MTTTETIDIVQVVNLQLCDAIAEMWRRAPGEPGKPGDPGYERGAGRVDAICHLVFRGVIRLEEHPGWERPTLFNFRLLQHRYPDAEWAIAAVIEYLEERLPEGVDPKSFMVEPPEDID